MWWREAGDVQVLQKKEEEGKAEEQGEC